MAIAAAAGASSEFADKFMADKLDEWFTQAKPVGQGLMVTDKGGCLFSVVESDKGLAIVAILDKAKKPTCRK